METDNQRFVYVDTDNNLREFDPKTGEGPVLEECRDRVLIEASESVENGAAQGVVTAYLGVDGHWHFAGLLNKRERLSLGLFESRDERERFEGIEYVDLNAPPEPPKPARVIELTELERALLPDRIKCIKAVRARTGCDLKEAYDATQRVLPIRVHP